MLDVQVRSFLIHYGLAVNDLSSVNYQRKKTAVNYQRAAGVRIHLRHFCSGCINYDCRRLDRRQDYHIQGDLLFRTRPCHKCEGRQLKRHTWDVQLFRETFLCRRKQNHLVEPAVRTGAVQLLLGEPQHAAGHIPRMERRPEHRNPSPVGAKVPTANLGTETKGGVSLFGIRTGPWVRGGQKSLRRDVFCGHNDKK